MKFDKLAEAYMNKGIKLKPTFDFNKVQRYEASNSPGDRPYEDENGTWVHIADYMELLTNYNELKASLGK
jgi:hypothetical protein